MLLAEGLLSKNPGLMGHMLQQNTGTEVAPAFISGDLWPLPAPQSALPCASWGYRASLGLGSDLPISFLPSSGHSDSVTAPDHLDS